jgi:hypothetical protein
LDDLREAFTSNAVFNQLVELDDVRLFLKHGSPQNACNSHRVSALARYWSAPLQAAQSATQVVILFCHSQRLAQVDVLVFFSA